MITDTPESSENAGNDLKEGTQKSAFRMRKVKEKPKVKSGKKIMGGNGNLF